jgi:Ca2+-binding RTX toxin-like protein
MIFFIGFKGLEAKANANATLEQVAINLGFLGAEINGGHINLEAGVKAGDAQFSSNELQNAQSNPLFDTIEKVNANFSLNLPIQVTPGLGFEPAGLVINLTADPFAQSLDGQRINLDLNLDSNFNEIISSFNTLDAGDFIGLLRQTISFLDGLVKSETIANFEIPFTKHHLSDVLDFADTLSDALLYDDGKDGNVANTDPNTNNGTNKLLDDQNKPIFNTAQDVFGKLAGTIDGVNYDPTTKELTYSLAFSNKLFNVDVPIAFDIDLAPIANITTDASLLLSGEAGMSLILGLSLGDVAGTTFLSNDTSLTTRANAAGSMQVTGNENIKGLNADGYKKTLTETTLTISGVAVSVQNDTGYNSAFELVRALNDAIAETTLKDQVTIKSQGKRLIVSANESFEGTLTVTPNVELGFIAEAGETLLEGNDDDFIITAQDGTKYGISLDGQQEITVAELQQVINDETNGRIKLAVNADNTALNLTDTQFNAESTSGLLSLTPTNGSVSALSLGILGVDANIEQGQQADGIVEGQAIGGPNIFDRLFMENAKLWGDLKINTPNGINATADFGGFVEIGLIGGGELSAHLETGLKSPGTDTVIGSRVTLAQLMDNLTGTNEETGKHNIHNVVAMPTLIGGIEQNGQRIYGKLDLEVTLSSSVSGIEDLLDGAGTPSLKLVVEHFGDPFGIDPNVEDGASPKITVDTTGLDGFKLNKFSDFGFDQIIDGLQTVSGFLSQFESFGFLDDPIPVINYSVNDLLGFVDDFNDAIKQMKNDPAGSIQKLENKLENALGLEANSDLIDLSLVDEDILKIELNLEESISKSLDIDLSLGDSSLFNLSGNADLDATGQLDFDLDFGISLSEPAQIYLFSTTGLAATLDINAANVAFRSAIGPMSFSVKDGSVRLGGSFNAGLKGINDRILISELNPSEHFSLDFAGTLDNNTRAANDNLFINTILPVYMPTESIHAGDLVIKAKNFSDVQILGLDEIMSGFDLSDFKLLDQVMLLVDGIDFFLEGLQDVMDGEIGGLSLPFIGDGLEEGARFIENFRQDFVEDFRASIENAAEPDKNFISQKLFELIGPSGLDLLQDNNGDGKKDITDIKLNTNIDQQGLDISEQFIEWDMDLGGIVFDMDAGIDFDIGIPGLGLETKGDLNLDINWALDFGFGINATDGVYFKLFDPNQPELRFNVLATLDDAELIGQLGFLQLAITEDGNDGGKIDPTYLLASFAVDLQNKLDAQDDHLSFSELSKLKITPKIAAKAEVNFDMRLSLSSDMVDEPSVFPNIRSDFVLEWSLGDFDVIFKTPDNPSLDFTFNQANPYIALSDVGDAIQDGLKLVEFQNVSLSLGSYISDFVGPILKKVQDVTEPLQPIVDFLTTPFPVLDDVGIELTFVDLAELYAQMNDVHIDLGYFDSVIEIIDFVNSIKMGGFDELWINFGNFTIFDINDNNLSQINLTQTNLKQLGEDQNYLDHALKINDDPVNAALNNSDNTRSGNRSNSASFYDKMKDNGSFDFPILSQPTQIFNLLLGKDATLITYDMKPLELEFQYKSPFISIFGPLGVRFGAGLGASIDFDFGFDTYGIRKFVDSDFVNPTLIFAGFFVDDGTHPELQITGELLAFFELNLAIAYGGVRGGLEATVDFDLFDPNRDGKVRVDEIINSVAFADYNPLAVFDISGDVIAKLEWYVGVDLKFKKWEKSGTLTDFELITFDVDFPRESVLGSDLDGGVLQLNMGDLADQRLNNNTQDTGEVFELTDTGNGIELSALGTTQTYEGVEKVVVRGGAGDDRIVLNGPSNLSFDIEGGVGNDYIDVSGTTGQVTVRGNAGDDTIITGSGDDRIWGDEGNDTIDAGGGVDWVFGDNGKIKERDDGTIEYLKVRTLDGDGNDTIQGGSGDDILMGGGALDTINGGDDNDLIIGDRGRVIFGDNTNSNTRAGERVPDELVKLTIEETDRGLEGGNDILAGDTGKDTIYGGIGNDEIFGGDDTDVLFGEKGADTIHGENGIDYIFGGDDVDKIFGGEDNDFLYGNDGGDEIQGDNGADEIHGGRGGDILHGNEGNDTIYGGSDPDLIYGDAGNDVLDGEAGSDIVFGYTGQFASLTEAEKAALTGSTLDIDQITSSLDDDVLDGEGQGDQYLINMSGGTTTKQVTVFDTGLAADGADKMTINSTTDGSENEEDKNDRFLLRAGAAQDTIAFVAMLNGTEDVERIDYDHRIEAMIINSFAGDDYFALDDNRAVTTINGGLGQDTFQVGQMFATPRTVEDAHIQPHDSDKPHDGRLEVGTDVFATIETTRGFLSNGISEATTINGGDDNDSFIVFHNKAVLGLNGGSGNDEFTIRAFALSGSQEVTRERTDLSGGSDADLIQYAVNAPVNIDGGDGLDEVRLIGTEFSDDFVVTAKGVFGAGLNVNFVNIELLKVDGAEGNDRFFIQSTDANLVTKLVGGLGSDSFNVGGDAPPIVSNDLLGHSGIISHTVVSEDPVYHGMRVEGISANIADNDEPGIVITQSDGHSVVNSTGLTQDAYTVVLTRPPAPGESVVVTALAPTKESENALIQFETHDGLKDSIQLVFDSTNWNVAQTVSFIANNEVVGSDSFSGVINHTISSEDSIVGTINRAVNDAPIIRLDQIISTDVELTGATIKITDGLGKGQIRGIEVANGSTLALRTAWNIVPDATSVYEITLADGQTLTDGQVVQAANNTIVTVNGAGFGLGNAGGELRGATLQIIGGAGAGQERLIMSNTADTLVLNKPWTTSPDSSSEFQILRYGAVQAPSVDVYINNTPAEPADTTQTPGVKVTQTAGSTDVIEGLNTDSYSLHLTQQPTAEVKIYVQPEPTITTRGQIFAKETQVAVAGDSLQSDEQGQFLVFTPENWMIAQTITVSAIDDGFVDGADTQVFAPMPQIINQVQGPLYMEGMGESEISIGAINNPLMLPDETNQKPALGQVMTATEYNITVETQNIPEKYGDLIDYTLEITAGEGQGQARIITGYNPDTGVIALDRAWETLPNETSLFTISTTNPNLLVDETKQVDVVTVFNNDSLTDDVGVLTENSLTGFGMGHNPLVLEGTTFQSGLNYFEMENFTANLGKGNNQLTINSTHTREDGFRTVTVINAGQGDDTIDVNLFADQGFTAIKGEMGNDNIDATDSELGIIAFGDEGDDQLTGGSGKDTLLGDLGRIDYLNEEGEVITRLGLTHDFSKMFAIPQQDDETPADQTDGVARSPTVILSLHEDIGGADKIVGLGGDDLIIGGSGADNIEGADNNDIVLGDNGLVNFDPNGQINTVSTITPLQGSGDIISGGSGHDLIFAGTGDDYVQGDGDNDLIFGDHGRAIGHVDLSTLPLATLTPAFKFETIDTQVTDGGGDDTLLGGAGEDIILGQQGADLIYGGEDDDDLIGGHNVAGGHDTGDRIGGGKGDDVIAGDNAIIERRGDTLSLLAQTLTGSTLYNANGVAQITGGRHADPAGTQIRNITLLDHSETTPESVYGDDYIVGSADNDMIFGQLGNDKLQGDSKLAIPDISATVAPDGTLTVSASVEDETDGDDYIEGNGGEDLLVGNLGQDDMIGGSSNLFGLTTPEMRPDGADMIFGGAETRIARNDTGLNGQMGHIRDADVILGDNANIFRMTQADSSHLRFNHDSIRQQVVRTYTLLDYTLGGDPQDIGTGDELHGEGGDDILHGMTGNDVLFGEGQNDDLYGGSGHDRLYGGTGVDGALGDDGLIYTSRNGTAEPLYGITTANREGKISIPGPVVGAIVYPNGQINKSVELLAYDQGATGNGNDVIYGGLGHDYLHGGEGDDAISGAEAQAGYYHSQPHVETITGIIDGESYTYQVETPIPFIPTPGVEPERGQFEAYDADEPRTKIAGFLLNFDAVDAQGNKIADGSDRIFGDLGHDWLVGGTENDRLFGGWGNDLMNADDYLETNDGLNNAPDAREFADGDFVFGGAGLDVMFANTGRDRLFDWSGEFNSYIVPFSPFGAPTVNRAVSPHIKDFVADLGLAGGADISLTEPYGELGLVTSADSGLWQDQKGNPRDPQPGNIPGVQMDDRGTPEWIEGNGGTDNTGKPDNPGNKPETSTNPTVDDGTTTHGNNPTGSGGTTTTHGNNPTGSGGTTTTPGGDTTGNGGTTTTPGGDTTGSGGTTTTPGGDTTGSGGTTTTPGGDTTGSGGTTTTPGGDTTGSGGTTTTPGGDTTGSGGTTTTPGGDTTGSGGTTTTPGGDTTGSGGTTTTPGGDTTGSGGTTTTPGDDTTGSGGTTTTPGDDTTGNSGNNGNQGGGNGNNGKDKDKGNNGIGNGNGDGGVGQSDGQGKPDDNQGGGNGNNGKDKDKDKGNNGIGNGNGDGGVGQSDGQGKPDNNQGGGGNGTTTSPPGNTTGSGGTTTTSPDNTTGNSGNGNNGNQNDNGNSGNQGNGNNQGNGGNNRIRSSLNERLNALDSDNSTTTSDIMLFDETTGVFVDSNEQSDPDDLINDDFLIIGKEDALSSGKTSLIAW